MNKDITPGLLLLSLGALVASCATAYDPPPKEGLSREEWLASMFNFSDPCSERLIKEGRLQPGGLAGLEALAFNSPYYSCPGEKPGDDPASCNEDAERPVPPPPPPLPEGMDPWSQPIDPEWQWQKRASEERPRYEQYGFQMSTELADLFFNETQYKRCSKIFSQGPLHEAVMAIPAPQPTDELGMRGRLDGEPDEFQARMLKVFGFIRWWRTCNHTVSVGRGVKLGDYNPERRRITIYSTACRAGDVYGSTTIGMGRRIRAMLVLGHELGHAIDHLNGTLHQNTESETHASRLGALIGLCYSLMLTEEASVGWNQILKEAQGESEESRKLLQEASACYASARQAQHKAVESFLGQEIRSGGALLKASACIELR